MVAEMLEGIAERFEKPNDLMIKLRLAVHDLFPHRAFAAFAAIWERLRGLRASALAVPPFRPPSRPSATAWGFLAGSTGLSAPGLNLGACPVDSSMIWYASWLGSRGRFFDRSSMTLSVWMQVGCQCQAFTELRTDQLSIRAERGSRIMRLPSMWVWTPRQLRTGAGNLS